MQLRRGRHSSLYPSRAIHLTLERVPHIALVSKLHKRKNSQLQSLRNAKKSFKAGASWTTDNSSKILLLQEKELFQARFLRVGSRGIYINDYRKVDSLRHR
jgi:hypothetical protein